MSDWTEATKWEGQWWNSCVNTYNEESKQIIYATKMGLQRFHDGKSPYNFDLGGVKVLDIGGGPVSILLKCINFKGTVIDPCDYPSWIAERYKAVGINYLKVKGEDLDTSEKYDMVMIYNVLQHVEDPEKIIKNALAVSKEIRIFEWLNIPVTAGHLHIFTENMLNKWLWGVGKTEQLNESGCVGLSYYGIFKGENYGL